MKSGRRHTHIICTPFLDYRHCPKPRHMHCTHPPHSTMISLNPSSNLLLPNRIHYVANDLSYGLRLYLQDTLDKGIKSFCNKQFVLVCAFLKVRLEKFDMKLMTLVPLRINYFTGTPFLAMVPSAVQPPERPVVLGSVPP